VAETKVNFSKYIARYGIYIALLLMFIIFSIWTPGFLSVMNMKNLLRYVSIIGVMSMGASFVIISGGIDLSVGSIMALSALFTTSFISGQTMFPMPVAILIGIVVGALCGAINGFLIARLKIEPFIITLATMIIIRGGCLAYTKGDNIKNISDAYNIISKGTVLNIPNPLIIFIVVAIIGYVSLSLTKFGRYVYMIGGNEQASILSGINVKSVKILFYVICGITAAFGGIMLSSRMMTGQPIMGAGYELDVIAAVVIGGASLAGGIGGVPGIIIGVLILGMINNGLGLLNVSSYYQQVIKGVIIILAVFADVKGRKYSD
jgi:ribose/xylose/arabinose/galactoside ABC-type transport system permease subunit